MNQQTNDEDYYFNLYMHNSLEIVQELSSTDTDSQPLKTVYTYFFFFFNLEKYKSFAD